MLGKLFLRLRRSRDIGSEEYEQLSVVQKTNMSEVWLARRKSDKVITVAKIARMDLEKYAKANQEALKNEYSWLKRFAGQSRIVQVYSYTQTTLAGKPYFIAMEYLAGGTLHELLAQSSRLGSFNEALVRLTRPLHGKPEAGKKSPNLLRALGVHRRRLTLGALTVEQALQICTYLAEGLALMHGKQVVHRDIKPDNVMFRQRPRHGEWIDPDNLVFIDLGIAAARDKITGAAISPGWSEPKRLYAKENRQRLQVHAGFDIYCLGKVLRFMLTHQQPTKETTEAELKTAIPAESLRFRSRIKKARRERIAKELVDLIRRCLNDNPEKRPTANDVARTTKQLLETLRPLPKVRRSRGRLLAAATTLIALSLIWLITSVSGFGPELPTLARVPLVVQATATTNGIENGVPTATPTALLAETPRTPAASSITDEEPPSNPTTTPTATATVVEPPPTLAVVQVPSVTVVPTEQRRRPPTPTVAEVPTQRPTPTEKPTQTATVTTRPRPVATATACPINCTQLIRPLRGQWVSGMVQVFGTAKHEQFNYYKVEYMQNENGPSFLFDGKQVVENGNLGVFNSAKIPNGPIRLRLTVVDRSGNYPAPSEVTITVHN